MEFTKEKLIGGAVQRDFALEVDGTRVPCVIWAAQGADAAPVLILMGHGGSQHKKTANIRARAVEYAERFGWATLAIDAPGHGDRISRDDAAKLAGTIGPLVLGPRDAPPMDAERVKEMFKGWGKAPPEWKAALDAALSMECIASDASVGYWGVSMGTAIGVPFVASEPRIRCAVFGLAGARPNAPDFLESAKNIQIPVEFVFQWDDAVAPRDHGIALFDAFGTKEKTMHINPGGHMEIPTFESDAWLSFFQRHLAQAEPAQQSA